ncbi:hypothetical protein N0V83_008218 [Neocucurbitaria cava]|uniref:RING-type domain-containing protein n=1 Tax=Neocucurbitaria cava TaxID=798079 RepID=A0A9W8Y283_9PLEO|nr:hypothetical protein N0V83_008218 [Neocucurbitaria cava]
MAIIKRPGKSKKMRPFGLGPNCVSFKVNNCDRLFTVHEDLLCANSEYFKEKLQKTRKPIGGRCPVCHERLHPTLDDITFCSAKCGKNMHLKCMKAWRKRSQAEKPRRRPTCPMCRSYWKQRTDGVVLIHEELDRNAVQLYIDWLYSGKLQVDEKFNRSSDEYNVQLLKGWTVSSTFKDVTFTYAIIAEYLSWEVKYSPSPYFGPDAAKYAFEDQDIGSMKRFVVDAFLVDIEDGWSESNATGFPPAFVRAVCVAAVRSMKKNRNNKDYSDLLSTYTDEHYMLAETGDDEYEYEYEDTDTDTESDTEQSDVQTEQTERKE